jgi:hypothetical protein
MANPRPRELFIIQRPVLTLSPPIHNQMTDREQTVMLALQQALLGEVSPNLRAVVVTCDSKSIFFECFYDRVIFETNQESMSQVETELLALFPEDHNISYRLTRSDFPCSIPKVGLWAYYRKE